MPWEEGLFFFLLGVLLLLVGRVLVVVRPLSSWAWSVDLGAGLAFGVSLVPSESLSLDLGLLITPALMVVRSVGGAAEGGSSRAPGSEEDLFLVFFFAAGFFLGSDLGSGLRSCSARAFCCASHLCFLSNFVDVVHFRLRSRSSLV